MFAYRANVIRCCLLVCVNGLANSRCSNLATFLQMHMPKQGRTDAGSIREVYNLYTDNTLSVTSITTVKGQTEKCIQVRVAIFIADSANMRWPCRVVILHQHTLCQKCYHEGQHSTANPSCPNMSAWVATCLNLSASAGV